jgi:hypothetical protein
MNLEPEDNFKPENLVESGNEEDDYYLKEYNQ